MANSAEPPTRVIVQQQAALRDTLPFSDTADFGDVSRGLIGRLQPCVVRAADGRVVWDNGTYGFLEGEAPDSVNPSLWRQSTLVARDGLVEVTGQLSPEMLFDAIAIRVDGPRAEQLTVDIGLSDTDQHYRLSLTNGVLTYSAAKQSEPADVSLTSSRASLPALALGPFDAESLAEAGIDVSGDAGVLTRLAAVLEGGDPDFAIVTPE